MVVSKPLSEGLKRIQEVRPQTMNNLRALDRQRHRLILGYASLPLVGCHETGTALRGGVSALRGRAANN